MPCNQQVNSDLIREFKQNGFVHIPNIINQNEIGALINAVEDTLHNPAFQHDLLTLNASQHTHKILYPLNKHPLFLRYIVHPVILSILSQLIEDPTQVVLTWEDILIKIPHEGIPVGHHQDLALQSTHHDIFSIALYFHDSTNNPVYYLPGSFRYGALTRDRLKQVVAEHEKEFVPVIAKAGDMVMHYVKTIHYSDTNTSDQPRYTWYLEYRTLDQLRHDSPWDEQWIQQRRAIFVAALQRYAPQRLSQLATDQAALKPYLDNLALRVSHTNETIQYDMDSPYNHFA